MSDETPNQPGPGAPSDPPSPSPADAPANPAMVVPRRRAASVQLRGSAGAEEVGGASLMDPANQSLADALRLTYRVIQLASIVLVVAFFLRGLQTIKANERGIRVTLGKDVADDLPPGLQISLPRPLGDIITISTADTPLRLDTQFWPSLRPEDANKSPADLITVVNKQTLNAPTDGYVLTADQNIAHVRVAVQFQRTNIRDNARTIYTREGDDSNEMMIITGAVAKGVTHAAAQLTIDELLKGIPDPGRKGPFQTIDELARAEAQRELDAIHAGVTIKQLAVTSTPPIQTLLDFAKVQASQSDAAKATATARSDAARRLSEAAGTEGAPALLALINRYESDIAAGKSADADATLAAIDAVFDGRQATLDGRPITAKVAGQVAGLLSAAQQYRSTVVSQALADANVFTAKLAAYRANPAVVLTGDWADAMGTFLGRPQVQVWMLPGNTHTLELLLNRDPDVLKKIETAAAAAEEQRIKEAGQKRLDDAKFDVGKPTNQPYAR